MWGMGQFPPYFYWELSPPLVSFISLTSSSNNHLKIDVMIIVTLEWSIPVTSPNNKVPRLPTFWFFFNVSYFIWILSPKLPCNTCVYLKTTELDWKGWALSEQAALGQAPLHTNRSVAGRGGQSLCTQNGGAVSTRGSIATPTLVASVKEKISPGTTWSFISYRKFNFLLWDHWHVVCHWPEWHSDQPECRGFNWKCQYWFIPWDKYAIIMYDMNNEGTFGVGYMRTIGNLLGFSIKIKLL